jgi:hypothetical protein
MAQKEKGDLLIKYLIKPEWISPWHKMLRGVKMKVCGEKTS